MGSHVFHVRNSCSVSCVWHDSSTWTRQVQNLDDGCKTANGCKWLLHRTDFCTCTGQQKCRFPLVAWARWAWGALSPCDALASHAAVQPDFPPKLEIIENNRRIRTHFVFRCPKTQVIWNFQHVRRRGATVFKRASSFYTRRTFLASIRNATCRTYFWIPEGKTQLESAASRLPNQCFGFLRTRWYISSISEG